MIKSKNKPSAMQGQATRLYQANNPDASAPRLKADRNTLPTPALRRHHQDTEQLRYDEGQFSTNSRRPPLSSYATVPEQKSSAATPSPVESLMSLMSIKPKEVRDREVAHANRQFIENMERELAIIREKKQEQYKKLRQANNTLQKIEEEMIRVYEEGRMYDGRESMYELELRDNERVIERCKQAIAIYDEQEDQASNFSLISQSQLHANPVLQLVSEHFTKTRSSKPNIAAESVKLQHGTRELYAQGQIANRVTASLSRPAPGRGGRKDDPVSNRVSQIVQRCRERAGGRQVYSSAGGHFDDYSDAGGGGGDDEAGGLVDVGMMNDTLIINRQPEPVANDEDIL
jgi:hypothetical protein